MPRGNKAGPPVKATPSQVLADLRGTLHQVVILLEDSEPWARHYLSLPAPKRLVDVERMASSITQALELLRRNP